MKNKLLGAALLLLATCSAVTSYSQAPTSTIVFGKNGRLKARDCTGTGFCVMNGSAACCIGTPASIFSFWFGFGIKDCNSCGSSVYNISFNLADAIANAHFPAGLDSGATYLMSGGYDFGNLPGFPAPFNFRDIDMTATYTFNKSADPTSLNAGLILQPVYWLPPNGGYTFVNPYSSQVNNDAVKMIRTNMKK